MFGACIMGNMGYESIELVELARPLIVWETAAVTDSGGAGQFRGAVSVRHRIQPLAHSMHLGFCGSGHTCAAFGLGAGQAGRPARHWIEDQASGTLVCALPNVGEADVEAHQSWVAETGGGGGSGDPRQRDVSAVLADVVDGFVSPAAALDVYGVVIEQQGTRWVVNQAATATRRASAPAPV